MGLILCTEAGPEQVALLSLHEGSIRVAEYLTVLPSREALARELFEAVRRGREQIARRSLPFPASPSAVTARDQEEESEPKVDMRWERNGRQEDKRDEGTV